MKTEVQRFCQQFSKELAPFGRKLDRAVAALTGQLGQINLPCLNEIRADLRDVQHRYRKLQERIEDQQAYLVIFGPLKSGKSTLMNAISGTYVSEVSSLPSYPALVYVKNAEQPAFEAVDYNGDTREFSGARQLNSAIRLEHERLASTLRLTESTGQVFEPARHLPEAIRRVNVAIPAQSLADSGTVLIDTPGLHTHMKFGYDQMARELRNTAACAIFVVKSDNLFFEKVFDEFEELLTSYGRLFLVTNVDSSKRDLQPDGSLTPSLESTNPGQVLDAFESLSMNPTLRQALEDGRLAIYPIDLLSAASRRLALSESMVNQAGSEALDLFDETSYDESEAVVEPAEALAGCRDDGFEPFLDDLANYLNSNEYVQAFMADSVKMAGELGQGTVDLAVGRAAEQLLESCVELRATIDKKQKQAEAIDKIKDFDWSASFRHLEEEKERLLETLTEGHARIQQALEKGLSDWFDSDESWHDLVTWTLRNILEQEVRHDAAMVIDHYRPLLSGYSGGARLNMFQMARLHQAGIRIEDSVPHLLRTLGQDVEVRLPRLDLQRDELPVKRSLVDIMLFRKRPKVLEKLFGSDGKQSIPAKKKRKRLAGGGEEHLKAQLQTLIGEQLPGLQRQYLERVLEDYREEFTRTLRRRVVDLRVQVTQDIVDCQLDLRERMQAVGILEGAKASAQKFTASLGQIQHDFDIRITLDVPRLEISANDSAEAEEQAIDSQSASAGEVNEEAADDARAVSYPLIKGNLATV